MRVATWNINHVTRRIDLLLDWLARTRPDVVALQELKTPTEDFPTEALRAAGYASLAVGQRTWNGVALLARGREPVEVARRLPGDPQDQEARYVEAAVKGVLFGCLYLPNGNPQPGPKFEYKLAWFERLIAHAATLFRSQEPVVLAGDYNVVPTDELDIYDARSWKKDALLQPQSRDCWQRLLAQGWVDAIRRRHPREKVFTFWDYFRRRWERDAGLRIDHLLLNPAAAKGLRDAGVDRWVRGQPRASDHAPAWVEIG
jgi:exodeoxyribonuclease III